MASVLMHARTCAPACEPKPRKVVRHIEDGIHRSIVHWLRAVLPGSLVLHVPNAPRSAIAGARLKGLGMLAGAPDLLVLLREGQGIWIEVKAPKGRLSPAQHAFADKCHSLDWPVIVARSVDDVRAAFVERGIRTREAA